MVPDATFNDVALNKVAAFTLGFSGADLKHLANEVALLAASENKTSVVMPHFDAAVIK